MRLFMLISILGISLVTSVASAESGVYDDRIIVGSVLDLEGRSRALGLGMRAGLEAAFKGQLVKGKRVEIHALNDSYNPELTAKATEKLISEDVFVMIGNVGTPTSKAALPLLAKSGVPAVGFFTGADLLRPGEGNIVNYRASYVQEVQAVISQALSNGVQLNQICAFVQNDAYGMAGVQGIKRAIRNEPGSSAIIQSLDTIMDKKGSGNASPDRNNIGPVGVYERNTLNSKDGYDSLKNWEKSQQTNCRLVVTVGSYAAIGRFAGYAHYKGETWMISAVSFTGADSLASTLHEFGVKSNMIVTQVVPPLDAEMPIVLKAKKELGDNFGYVSLEGYIVGTMFIELLRKIDGPITREGFLSATRNTQLDIGGVGLDFRNDNQGSDLVTAIQFRNNSYQSLGAQDWAQLFN